MNWQEITIDTEQILVEGISNALVECGAGGVAIEDPEAIKARIKEEKWDAFEFPKKLLKRNYVRIKAYFPSDDKLIFRKDKLKQYLNFIQKEFPDCIKNISFSEVREEDWANSWKAYYKPVKISQKIAIKPTWEKYNSNANDIIIELDPGMAFGTGTHPTTVMCIKFLEMIIKGNETVFDIGTGSGILSIAAAKLGASRVKAVDNDDVAVEAARSNVGLNQVDDVVEVINGNLLDEVNCQADVIVSNIVADVIIGICPDAVRVLKPGGHFITSGIIAPRETEVIAALNKAGFKLRDSKREGDWVSFWALKES